MSNTFDDRIASFFGEIESIIGTPTPTRSTRRKVRAATQSSERCRCGRKRKQRRASCATCLRYHSAYNSARQKAHRQVGLCSCGRVRVRTRRPDGTVRELSRCKRCLADQRRWDTAAQKWLHIEDPTASERVAACKKRWRDAGNCITCGRKASINPRTGEPYSMCDKHLELAAAARQLRMQRAVRSVRKRAA